jgi:hypothetical protein
MEPLAYPFRQFCRNVGISIAQGYVEINAGRLKAHKRGASTIIKAEDAKAWLDSLPAFEPKQAA